MNGVRDIKSFWWLPEQPETRWFGVLTLATDHTPTLELVIERQNYGDAVPIIGAVLHGKDEQGKHITLLFVGSAGQTLSGGILKIRLRAGYALIGIAIPEASSFVSHSLRFHLQQLHNWLGRSGFIAPDCEPQGVFAIHYQHQPAVWFEITEDLELGIQNTFTMQNTLQERRISEDSALTIRSKAGLSLTRCRELVGTIRRLLHFASLETIYPVSMTSQTVGHGYQAGDAWVDQPVEIISSVLREAQSDSPTPDRWIFRFDDVCGDFAGFIRNWLDYNQKFAEAIDCYSSTIYHSLTSVIEHLSLTQALEAYHGIKFTSHKKFEFQNKIKELTESHAASLKGLVDDPADFADRVNCTRNHYTHHNPKWMATGKVAERDALIQMNEKLRLIFQMCVLTDLAIPADRFTRLRRQLSTSIINYA